MNYEIKYTTKKGASNLFQSSNPQKILGKVKSLFAQRIEARVFQDDNIIGYVWKDDTQVSKWNYSVNFGKEFSI